MSIHKHYLQTASHLVASYDGSFPLHHFLRQFFSQHKKYGSRDRKLISGLCYNYYRLGKALATVPVEEKIIAALFICSNEPNVLLADLNGDLNDRVTEPLQKKLQLVGVSGDEVFAFKPLSAGIDHEAYALSMLRQPNVFIRIRPGRQQLVEDRLQQLGWNYNKLNEHTISVAPGIPVDKNFHLDKEVVIQDINSQRIGLVVKKVFEQYGYKPRELWDCCAASGGKSIMMYDMFPGLKLTVSDIRKSILQNLSKRFKEAGIAKYHAFVADISLAQKIPIKPVSFIVADVPCTGSGTWSRTPEQLHFFDESTIDTYAKKQVAITANALKYLLPGGWFVYITCSVFKQENEEVVDKLLEDQSCQLVHQEVLSGMSMQADSMFVTMFRSAKI